MRNREHNPLSTRTTMLASACIAMFALGFVYGWSVFSAPLAAEFQWPPSTLAFSFTMLMWTMCAGGFAGAKVCKLTNSRFTVVLSAICIFAAFASSALLARADAPWILYLTYGLFGGLGVGMAYSVIMATTLAWFPDKAGTASGFMLLCYGVSTMILSSAAAALFERMNWRVAFITIAAAMAVVLVVCGAVLLRHPTESEVAHLPQRDNARIGTNTASTRNFTMREMLRTPVFWSFAFWMIPLCIISLGWTSQVNQFALEAGAQPAFAVALVGVYSVCNGLGRLLFGVVYDTAGAFRTILAVAIMRGLGALLIVASIVTQSMLLLAFTLAFAGISIGGVPVCAAGFVATTFGPRNYAQNLSCMNLTNIPSALAGPLIMSTSVSAAGGYVPGLLVLASISVISIVLSFVTKTLLEKLTKGS